MSKLVSVQSSEKRITKPSVMTKKAVRKLSQALQAGLSVSAACNHARISTTTYYDHIKDDPLLADYLELCKKLPVERARQNVIQAIAQGDLKASMWYLERACPEEFNPQRQSKVIIREVVTIRQKDLKV
jgi:hypothetical protein